MDNKWVTPEPDVVATATPLESIGHFSKTVPEEIPDLWDLFLGVGLVEILVKHQN